MVTKRKSKVVVGNSQTAGFGLFAVESFSKNDFIIEYVGEVEF